MNAEIAESREELESQCTTLHGNFLRWSRIIYNFWKIIASMVYIIGMNIALQKEKLAFQDRIDDIEESWQVITAVK